MRSANWAHRNFVMLFRASLLFIALLGLIGCGKSTGKVTGKVTYQNKPLEFGSVQLETSRGAFVGQISSDGSYTVEGVPTGTAKVSITCQDPKYAAYMKQLSASARDKSIPKPKGSPEDFNKIPSKYGDFSTSGLTIDVKGGSQSHDINLE